MKSLRAECCTSSRPIMFQKPRCSKTCRRVCKKPPQADVDNFKAKCSELRRLVTAQEVVWLAFLSLSVLRFHFRLSPGCVLRPVLSACSTCHRDFLPPLAYLLEVGLSLNSFVGLLVLAGQSGAPVSSKVCLHGLLVLPWARGYPICPLSGRVERREDYAADPSLSPCCNALQVFGRDDDALEAPEQFCSCSCFSISIAQAPSQCTL